jgi:hypothetical protein
MLACLLEASTNSILPIVCDHMYRYVKSIIVLVISRPNVIDSWDVYLHVRLSIGSRVRMVDHTPSYRSLGFSNHICSQLSWYRVFNSKERAFGALYTLSQRNLQMDCSWVSTHNFLQTRARTDREDTSQRIFHLITCTRISSGIWATLNAFFGSLISKLGFSKAIL